MPLLLRACLNPPPPGGSLARTRSAGPLCPDRLPPDSGILGRPMVLRGGGLAAYEGFMHLKGPSRSQVAETLCPARIRRALRGGPHFLTPGAPGCHGRKRERKAQAPGSPRRPWPWVVTEQRAGGRHAGRQEVGPGERPPGLRAQGPLRSWAPCKVPEIHGFGGHCSRLT